MAKADLGLEQRIAAVRRFNRFYTQRIGVLREHLLDSPRAAVGAMLGRLAPTAQLRVVEARRTIATSLGEAPEGGRGHPPPYLLRPHQPGDIGWVIHRHGALYAQEYGYDERFEALV